MKPASRRGVVLVVFSLLLSNTWSIPLRAEGGAGGAPPPAPDNRFFPKEMEDALAALQLSDPEDSFQQGLGILARLRMRDGAVPPLLDSAFAPVLEHALTTRLEHVASFAGEFLAALDENRLRTEVAARIKKPVTGKDRYNAAVLLENCRGDATVNLLAELVGDTNERVRTRAIEALGEVAMGPRAGSGPEAAGASKKLRETAADILLRAYSAAGKGTDAKNVCAVALGKVGNSKAVPALAQGVGQTDNKHGFFAALALSWIGQAEGGVFEIISGLTVGGGESGEAHAKAIEGSARRENVSALIAMVQGAGQPEMREAAATALGRILPKMQAPAPDGTPTGDTKEARAESELRLAAVKVLMDRMNAEKDPYNSWACFHSLGRAGGPWLAEPIMKTLKGGGGDDLARAIHLAGDWKLTESASIMLRALFSVKDKDVMLRKRVATEFWRVADREAIDAFKEKVRNSPTGPLLERACDALGLWKTEESFRFCMELLKISRPGRDQFQVELALEKMTGHFFGPSVGLWEKWYGKNPSFFTPKQAGIEREKWREEFDKENKGFRQTKETEKSVQMGLEYLARHQDMDGAWDPTKFTDCCDLDPGCSVSMGARVQEDPVSRVALSVLAFLGAGYNPETGKFKSVVRRGLEYLMARQQAHGDYLTNDLIGGYNRPVALQAYAEALAVTGDPVYLPFVQKGADFLMQIQNSIGGWRYRVRVETSDSSVAAWMLFSMKAAEKAGVNVREIVYEGCRHLFTLYSVRVPVDGPREEYMDMDPEYGFEVGRDTKYQFRTGYQDRAQATTHATTALGLMSHILLGFRRSHPFCIGSANHILAAQLPEIPKGGDLSKLNISQEYPMYFLYYATLAMHQMGGRYFREWNERLREILPGTQVTSGCSRGAWIGKNYDGIFGSIYTTATGALTLETYYRYAPVLQN